MQLRLTLDELKIITRALEKCLAHSQGETSQQKHETANRLLDKVIAHDLKFGSDELEDLSDMLSGCRFEMKRRISAEQDERTKAMLRDQQLILEHAADKITEVCAMA